MSKEPKESKVSTGWGRAHCSHRFHYFTEKTSACGRYLRRAYDKKARDAMRRMPQDCDDCWRAMAEAGVITRVPPEVEATLDA